MQRCIYCGKTEKQHDKPCVDISRYYRKCRFCGDLTYTSKLDTRGICTVCVNGMERTNGD